MAGSVGITEGGLMCLDSSLVNSDEMKAGWWWVGGLYGVSEALRFNLDSSQCWSPKAHKKGSGCMGGSWNMVGTPDSLRLRSMDASSWDLQNFGVLLWRRSDLDVVSVFCGSCRQLPHPWWLKATNLISCGFRRSQKSVSLSWNQRVVRTGLPLEVLGKNLFLASSSIGGY